MIKNNKGLTLVELLAVIVLISLLLGLGIPGINRIRQNMSKKSLNTKVKLIEQAAVLWGQDNKTMLQKDDCSDVDNENKKCYQIKIEELIIEDYLESESHNEIIYTNPETNKDMIEKNCYVRVYKKNNRVYAMFDAKDNCDA